MKKSNIVCALIGMIVSGFAFGYTFTFKKFKNVAVGPEFFPRALAVLLFACCLVLLVQNLIPLLKGVSDTKENPTLSLRNPGIHQSQIGRRQRGSPVQGRRPKVRRAGRQGA